MLLGPMGAHLKCLLARRPWDLMVRDMDVVNEKFNGEVWEVRRDLEEWLHKLQERKCESGRASA